MDEGTIVRWLVAPGDVVHRGDIVATVETEKATIDAEIFEDGVVESILVEEGRRVPVGTPLATIAAAGAAPPRPPSRRPPARRPAPEAPIARPPAVTPLEVPAAAAVHVRASPHVRRRARELGVDLAAVEATGPGGVVTEEDLERARQAALPPPAPPVPPAPPPGPPPEAPPAPVPEAPSGGRSAAEQQRALRRQIGVLMARSKREIPHYYLETTIDLSRATAFLAEENAERLPERRLLPAALLVKATAVAARAFPDMNGFYVDDDFRPSTAVHVGVVVALRQGGILAPAIHDVDQLSLDDVMAQMADLVTRVRAGRLKASEMADPTITVTNLGDLGADAVYGVIYPPQVALVGFGRIGERPVAVDGLVGARPTVTVTLAADHRVSDGLRGARFLAAVGRLLQDPEEL